MLAVSVCFTLLVLAAVWASNLFNEQFISTASANTNWGLSFRQPGQPPEGNASAGFLKSYDAYYVGSSDK